LLSMIQLNAYVILSEMAHLTGSDEIEAEIVQIMDELVGEKII
jgi:hypothetical protein